MGDEIVMLRGPERIRRRPAVIFGSEDLQGAQQAVRSMLEIFATEAQLGHCRQLGVIQEGAQITICADDRGIDLGQDNRDDTQWERIFGQMFAHPANYPEEAGYSFGLQDSSHHLLYGDTVAPNATFFPEDDGHMGLYCAQCVTQNMVVISVRNGVKSTLRFEGGYNIGGIRHENSDDARGTCFRFALDPQVFSEVVLPGAFFVQTLDRFAMLAPGLTCAYINTGENIRKEYSYPDGVADYAQKKTGDKNAPVYCRKITAKGRERYNRAEYEACVEIAIAPAPGRGAFLCMHNFRELTYGGTHEQQMQKAFCAAMNEYFLSYILENVREDGGEKHELKFEDLRKHFAIVLVSWCSPHCTAWVNGTRTAIQNRMIADMTYDAMRVEFRNYVYENKEALRPMVDAILAERND